MVFEQHSILQRKLAEDARKKQAEEEEEKKKKAEEEKVQQKARSVSAVLNCVTWQAGHHREGAAILGIIVTVGARWVGPEK